MEQPKGYIRGKGGKYWVCYQPEGDSFTHITYYFTYDDAVEMFNAIRIFYRERRIPIKLHLLDLETHKRLLELDTTTT